MQLHALNIADCFKISPKRLKDQRGEFIKIFQKSLFDLHGLPSNFIESYSTFSHTGVIRGMHFQVPPFDHSKLIRCVMGEVLDVILDIRIGSPTYLQTEAIKLSRDLGDMVFLPPGIAHGFFSVTDALMEYLVTSEYSPEHDSGIYWNSINFQWPNQEVITSSRDDRLLPLKEFNSPFIYQKNNI